MRILATGFTSSALTSAVAPSEVRSHRRRRISPQAGHALEILGHAIEYLTDEYIHEGGSFSAQDPRIEAVQLLMARNRAVYFACPEISTLGDRLRAWLHLNQAAEFHRKSSHHFSA